MEPLAALSTQDLALYWHEVLERRLRWQQAPALPPTFEWFGIPQSESPSVILRAFDEAMPHRALFFSPDETALVQVQRDRFIRNWRKANAQPYPRYESIRKSFAEQFQSFRDFVEKHKLGSCKPNQCEVTYVNHVPWGRDEQPREALSEVLAPWCQKTSDSFLPEPESVDIQARYVIHGPGNELVGRLHVAASPQYRRDDLQPLLALTLTARGRPAGDALDDVMRFFDLGRENVVRGFASMTTPAMHKRWGRRA